MNALTDLAELFASVIALAVAAEAIAENINDVSKKLLKRKPPNRLIAVAIACGLTLYLKVDLLSAINGVVSPLGMVITGLIASRGGNYVNDTLSLKRLLKEDAKHEP